MIFVSGATGFVGRHLVEALGSEGYRVRCLVRSEGKAGLCRSLGFETTIGDVTDRESLRGVLEGVETVLHLVGIIREEGEATFERVHVRGTENLLHEAGSSGVKHFFFQSALGASLDSPFKYHRTKAEAERLVMDSGIPYTIFRPSLIIGPGDGFTERMKELLRLGPVVPVPGDGEGRFQPIFIDDLVRCILKIIDDPDARGRVYELGGPEYLTYNEMLKTLMKLTGVEKPVMHLPVGIVKTGLFFTGVLKPIIGLTGLRLPDASAEQIDLLQVDNIAELDSVERAFGFKPLTFEDALRKTLSRPDPSP